MISIDPNDFLNCNNEDDLEYLLQKYNFKKYVAFNNSIQDAINRFPILGECFNNDYYQSFSSLKMNYILKKDIFEYQCRLTSFAINAFLNLYYDYIYVFVIKKRFIKL